MPAAAPFPARAARPLLALASGLAAFALRAEDPVRVGEYASLTGKEASWGQSSHKGITMAVEEINAAGGVYLLDRHRDPLVRGLAPAGFLAGQRGVFADPDRVLGAQRERGESRGQGKEGARGTGRERGCGGHSRWTTSGRDAFHELKAAVPHLDDDGVL